MVYQRMKQEHERLQQEIRKLQKKMNEFPKGKLICAKGGGIYRWYCSDGHNKKYIPRKNRKLAEQLAAKKYCMLQIEEYEKEKTAVEFYLRHHSDIMSEMQQKLWDHPEYQRLLRTNFLPRGEKGQVWMRESFERNPHYSEGCIHKAISGDMVRSKSEAMIAYLLYTNHIPFRYECVLHLGEVTLYPDFTILHPRTGQCYYWEHFGRMDDAGYAKNAVGKLQHYIASGLIPTIQLITTYETSDHPLTMEVIEDIIRRYFL